MISVMRRVAVNPGETGGADAEVTGTDDVLHIFLHCLKFSNDTELVMTELTVEPVGQPVVVIVLH